MSELRQRDPRVEDKKHLVFIRSLVCVICGRPYPDAAHLRAGSIKYEKRSTGMQEKPSDCWALPLCRDHHTAQHRMNELSWWMTEGILDPFALAIALYAVSGDHESGMKVLREATR